MLYAAPLDVNRVKIKFKTCDSCHTITKYIYKVAKPTKVENVIVLIA